MSETLTEAQIREADLTDWQVAGTVLRTRLRSGDFATGLRLLNLIGLAAEAANHHPDIYLTYPHVDITLTSHDVGGLTDRDVRMARQISDIAAREDVVAGPEASD